MHQYDHTRIEKKWRRVWKEIGLYKIKDGKRKPKQYILDMFPYLSGEGLHVGHPKGYIATDVYSRLKRMQGHAVLHPMGFDAFGLPAENYAIKNKINPSISVKKNVRRFKKQLEALGFDYDWSREINTTDPNYYRVTQWIFLQMFHRGLAYRSNEPINWCPSCQTGLANEDLEDGKCERCGSLVEKRPIPQWVLKITDYADRLLEGLPTLSWPESIKEAQKNWIGRSEGINITYTVEGHFESVTVFTTRPDTNFGATFIVAAPDSSFVSRNSERFPEAEKIKAYIVETKTKSDIERIAEGRKKTGVFTGWYATNQLNGKRLPIYVGDFVLGQVGTGIVVGVPGHDKRDFEFAQAMSLEVVRVVIGPDKDASPITHLEQVQEQAGVMTNSRFLDGLDVHDATTRIMDYLEQKGWGKRVVNYKLRDWVFSRQRYWGEPIPLVFCEDCRKRVENSKSQNPRLPIGGQASSNQNPKSSKFKYSKGEQMNPGWVGIPEDKLPVKLPKVKSYEPTGTGESPLAAVDSFVNTKCPKCGGPAKRETNTMPQWAGSCWYHLAYVMRGISNFQFPISKYRKAFKNWLPVDMYVGGAEHATRHLIYARFWHKFLYDIGVVTAPEPFARLQNVGLIQAADGRKMSKRYGNVINPDNIVAKFGADSLRVYEMFMGPFNQSIAWSTDSLVGARRFLERVWRLRGKLEARGSKLEEKSQFEALLHQTIKKVGDDIEQFKFNTSVSSLMILLNAMEKQEAIEKKDLETLLLLLAPLAPHMTEELWAGTGHKKSIHGEKWPVFDAQLAKSSEVTIIVQINGKMRGSFAARRNMGVDELKAKSKALPELQKYITGREIQKIIVVPDRLVNIVIP